MGNVGDQQGLLLPDELNVDPRSEELNELILRKPHGPEVCAEQRLKTASVHVFAIYDKQQL